MNCVIFIFIIICSALNVAQQRDNRDSREFQSTNPNTVLETILSSLVYIKYVEYNYKTITLCINVVSLVYLYLLCVWKIYSDNCMGGRLNLFTSHIFLIWILLTLIIWVLNETISHNLLPILILNSLIQFKSSSRFIIGTIILFRETYTLIRKHLWSRNYDETDNTICRSIRFG